MAVSFKVEDVVISALRDRAMFNTFAGNQSYVIEGVGQELQVNYSSQSFVVELLSGEAVICGGSMMSEGEENTLTLGANETGYVVIRVDLSQTGENICQLYKTPSLVQGNINNGSDYIYDLPLYQYATNGNGVQNFNDVRNIKSSAISFDNLDTTISGMGAGKTLKTLKQEDGLISATFQNISITKSQVSDFPTIPAAVAVKGNAESSYRTGNVNLTPANIGACPSAISSQTQQASSDCFVLTDNTDSQKVIRSKIALGSSTTTFLRNDGSWATPPTPASTFYGIDTASAAIKSGTTGDVTWTATQDCWCIATGEQQNDGEMKITIGNVVVAKAGSNGNVRNLATINAPIKSGQVVKITGQASYAFYKIKA